MEAEAGTGMLKPSPDPPRCHVYSKSRQVVVKLHMVAYPNQGNFCLETRENMCHRTSKQAITLCLILEK